MEQFLAEAVEIILSSRDAAEHEERIAKLVREKVRTALEQGYALLDGELMRQRPSGLKVVGFRTCTRTMAIGDVQIRRRLYRDGAGRSRYLLDEALGLEGRVSVRVEEMAAMLYTRVTFRQASEFLRELSGVELSPSTLQRMKQRLGRRSVEAMEAQQRAVYEYGVLPEESRQEAYQFIEADGVMVRLQRDEARVTEIKHGIRHVGWEQKGKGDRYALKEKVHFADVCSGDDFWERFSVKTAGIAAEKTVINGDDAPWIRQGKAWFPQSEMQMDRFHLMKWMREMAAGQAERAARGAAAIRSEDWDALAGLCDEVMGMAHGERSYYRQRARALKSLIKLRREDLGDYRKRLGLDGETFRGLGAIEANNDKLIVHRMKKRGMAWTAEGARMMAHVLTLRANGDLRAFIRNQPPTTVPETVTEALEPRVQRTLSRARQASVPLLKTRYQSTPTGHALHDLVG